MPRPLPAHHLLAGFIKSIGAGFLLLSITSSAAAFDASDSFPPMTLAISAEGSLVRFESDRLPGAYINAWDVGARFSLLPFGVIHAGRLFRGTLDGAFEVGLEPTFERFNSVHQSFAGVLLKLRYHLVRLNYGHFVPWIGAAIGPGYSDLNIGQSIFDTKLKGPFMALIMGEVGVEYLFDGRGAIYAGLQAQHVSNSGLNGKDHGSSTNVSLNTPWGLVVGVSWFLPDILKR